MNGDSRAIFLDLMSENPKAAEITLKKEPLDDQLNIEQFISK